MGSLIELQAHLTLQVVYAFFHTVKTIAPGDVRISRTVVLHFNLYAAVIRLQ